MPRQNAESQTTTAAQQAIAESKERLDNAVREYALSQQVGGERAAVAPQQLHAAVIDLFWRLRSHLYQESDAWDDLAEYSEVEREVIWTGAHPHIDDRVVIEGLGDLDEWVCKEVEVEVDASGPTSTSTKRHTTTVALPAGAAIEAAKILLLEYQQFSLGIDVSIEQQTKIDKELLEEVEQWRKRNV